MSGTGTLILGGTNAYTGFTTMNAGIVQISSDGNLGASSAQVVFGGGTLQLTGNVTSARTVNLQGTGTLLLNDGTASSFNAPGVIQGTGPIQIATSGTGTGTVAFSALNSYSGGTNLLGATLQISAPGNIGSGPVSFGNGSTGGTLELLSPGFASQTLPNNIKVNAPGGTLLVDGAGTSPVLSGNITGTSGNLTINQPGGSTLILSGSNTFSGTMTVMNPLGTLQINSNNGLLSSNVVNNGSLVFNQTGAALVGGSISGPGAMSIVNGGLVRLTGASTFTGPTTVMSGSLFVDGSSTGSPITVNAGALLGGSGQVQNVTVQTGGILAPGDGAPGTLSGSSFTLASGSILQSIMGNTSMGEIAATGALNITPGATLSITTQGTFKPQVTRYTLATAGSITPGVKFILANPLPSSIFEILYFPQEIILLVSAPPYANFLPPGNPRNTAVCFTQLSAQNLPDLKQLATILALQVPSQLQHSFNQMHPANFDDLAYAAENVAERIRQMYTLHYLQQRGMICHDRDGWRLWGGPFFQKAHQDGEELFSSYDQNFTGFTTALDYHKRWWLFSAGFSYASTHVNMPHGRANGGFNSYSGTLGAAWSNNLWFADAQASYLYSPIHAERRMDIGVTIPGFSSSVERKAHHYDRSNQIMGHLGAGYDVKVMAGKHGTTNFYPFANVDYMYNMQSGYREKGAQSLNLKVHGKEYDYLRPEMGLGIGYHGCFKAFDVWADVSASYVLEFRLIGRQTNVNFTKSSCQFHVHGLNPENNLICPDVQIRLVERKWDLSLGFGYHGEFGANFIENAGQAELRQAF